MKIQLEHMNGTNFRYTIPTTYLLESFKISIKKTANYKINLSEFMTKIIALFYL